MNQSLPRPDLSTPTKAWQIYFVALVMLGFIVGLFLFSFYLFGQIGEGVPQR